MPIITRIPAGTVSGIWGQAYRVGPKGKLIALQIGDKIVPGEQLLTADNGIVRITDPEGPYLPVKAAIPIPLESLLADLNLPSPKNPTSTGMTGGSGSLEDGYRVTRIVETTPSAFQSASPSDSSPSTLAGLASTGDIRDFGTSSQTAGSGNSPPPSVQPPGSITDGTPIDLNNNPTTPSSTLDANNDQVSTQEDVPVNVNVLNNDRTNGANVQITQINGQSLVEGTPIAVEKGSVTLQPDGQITFTPDPNSHGSTSFTYTMTDGSSISQATVTVQVSPVNDAPIAIAPPASTTPEETPISIPLQGIDVDGSISSITLTNIPGSNQGSFYLADGVTPVGTGTPITPEQASQLVFKPAPDFHGQVNFEFIATDNDGATSQPTSSTITVTSNDTSLASVSDAAAAESAGFMTFTVTLNQPSDKPVSVNYETVAVSATTGSDFTPVAGTLIFEPGQTSQTVTVPVQPDTLAEGNETFNMVLSQPQGLGIADGTGIGTILDADNNTQPTVNITGPTVVNEGAAFAIYTVSLSTSSSNPVTVSYATQDGSAQAGLDFESSSGSLTFNPGTTTQTIVVPIINDGTYEGPESFNIALGTVGNASVNTGSVTTQIHDDGSGSGATDDDRPTLHVNDVNTSESAGFAVFSVSLSNPSTQATTVNLLATPGTASSPADFDSSALEVSMDNGITWQAASTLTLAPGVVNGLVRVPVVNDGLPEGTENFSLTATTTAGTTVNPSATGTASLSDDISGSGLNLKPDSFNTPEDQTLTGNVLNNDGIAQHPNLEINSFSVNGKTVPTDTDFTLEGIGTINIKSDGNFSFTPAPNFHGNLPTISYTASDGASTTASSTLNIAITPINDAPIAVDDHPNKQLTEDNGQRTSVTGHVISGGNGDMADHDVDGDALLINGIVVGQTPPSDTGNSALPSPTVVEGIYGNLTIQPDGSYTYQLDNSRPATQNLAEGEQKIEHFSYSITDGHGGSDSATLSITINGTADTAPPPFSSSSIDVTGLSGEYFGYNDAIGLTPRSHQDDGTARFAGPNLNSIEDVETIINGRNALVGNSGQIVGSANASDPSATDAHFAITRLHYGSVPDVNNNLGNNPSSAPGEKVTQGRLYDFLGGGQDGTDSASLIAQPGAPTGNNSGVNTGLGKTSDAIIRATGDIFLERGNYDFRVTGDDGFSLRVGGETLVEYDGNQYPITRMFSNVEVGDHIDGLRNFELLYWEQGRHARLHVEYRKHGEGEWSTLSTENTALFAPGSAPEMFDHRVQDIVAGSRPGEYILRTGSVLDGDASDNTLIGSAARDVLQGGAGNDVLLGKDGSDTLVGGLGEDRLSGEDGSDILIGGPGIDHLDGGMGDDIYRIDASSIADQDVVIELADQGTDTVEFGVAYTSSVDLRTLSNGHIENVSVAGPADIHITGSDVDNRLTGGLGNNIIDGGLGRDRVIGGQGNDQMTGGLGSDTFEWHLADQRTPGQPAIDVITDFNLGSPINEGGNPRDFGYSNIEGVNSTGDRLDLRDLLQGEHSTQVDVGNWATPNIGNLANYIDVSTTDGNTTIRLSTQGQFAGGVATDQTTDQIIQLAGLDIWSATGITPGDETALLQRLLKNGTLVVD